MSQELALLNRSALVVAHPDDEILWFSSIVKRVDRVVICFSAVGGNEVLSEGREKALDSYPLSHVESLRVSEAGVFDYVDWRRPQLTPYGIALRPGERHSQREAAYIANYEALSERLSAILAGCQNVITHNPWGEYGHAEHVQVYRAVRNVRERQGFDLWFSNYCSDKTFGLAASYISGFRSDYITLRTEKALAAEVRDLYYRNGCWTWYSDYEWFNDESFIRDDGMEQRSVGYGHMFPFNVVRIDSAACESPAERRPPRRGGALARLLGAARLSREE